MAPIMAKVTYIVVFPNQTITVISIKTFSYRMIFGGVFHLWVETQIIEKAEDHLALGPSEK